MVKGLVKGSLTRRSIRKYKSEQLTEEQLQTLPDLPEVHRSGTGDQGGQHDSHQPMLGRFLDMLENLFEDILRDSGLRVHRTVERPFSGPTCAVG